MGTRPSGCHTGTSSQIGGNPPGVYLCLAGLQRHSPSLLPLMLNQKEWRLSFARREGTETSPPAQGTPKESALHLKLNRCRKCWGSRGQEHRLFVMARTGLYGEVMPLIRQACMAEENRQVSRHKRAAVPV